MPGTSAFLLRALAYDPMSSTSLLHQTKLSTGISHPQPPPPLALQLEDIMMKPDPDSTAASEPLLEQEELDLDLPSSIVEEIEVCNSQIAHEAISI